MSGGEVLFQISQGAALVLADNALNLRIQVFLHFEYQMSSTHRYCFSWSCSLAGSTLTGNFSMKLVVGIFRTFTFFKSKFKITPKSTFQVVVVTLNYRLGLLGFLRTGLQVIRVLINDFNQTVETSSMKMNCSKV